MRVTKSHSNVSERLSSDSCDSVITGKHHRADVCFILHLKLYAAEIHDMVGESPLEWASTCHKRTRSAICIQFHCRPSDMTILLHNWSKTLSEAKETKLQFGSPFPESSSVSRHKSFWFPFCLLIALLPGSELLILPNPRCAQGVLQKYDKRLQWWQDGQLPQPFSPKSP